MSEPWDGRPGVAKDGTPVVWVASLGRGLPIAQAKAMGVAIRQQPPGPGGGVSGYDMAASDPKFAQRMATERAAADVKKLTAASEGVREGFGNEQNALGAEALLKADTPTGPFAKTRIGAGRAVGSLLGGVMGIPTQQQTTNLEQLQTLANQGTLGNVSQLKGPLSDRDVVFLKTLQYDPNATRAHNLQVVEAQKWASARQAAYGSAMRSWTKVLGSPSALNANGLDFDRWWGQYSEQHLPRPGVAPVDPRAQANAALKAKSGKTTGQPVLLGYE